MKNKLLTLILLSTLLLSSCGNDDSQKNKEPVVYTSFYPIYDLVDMVSDYLIKVESFQPKDKDPHLWEPSPRDIKRLQDGDLLIVNGANMEKWLDDVQTALPDLEILVLSDGVELITYNGAAAMGDFQYMSELELDKEFYGIRFGHTHENLIRIAFIKKIKITERRS